MKSFREEFNSIRRLCESDKYKNEIDNLQKSLLRQPIVLYGAGSAGVAVARIFRNRGLDVVCFCDKNKTGIQQDTGIPIISPQMLLIYNPDAIIFISSTVYADEIMSDLTVLGVPSDRVIANTFFNLHEVTISDIEHHLSDYERVFNLFNDCKSKEIILGRLQCFLTPSPLIPSYITPIRISPYISQYFDESILMLSSDEIFVDGGMYIGDTAELFFRFTNGNYKHYYGFEPDIKNSNVAREKLEKKPNITIIAKGLWCCETEIGFTGNSASTSKVDMMTSHSLVSVTALDSYFNDKSPPTFIKMDIEGAELEALKGAEHIIRKYKPKLAICVYHKPEDIYELPELLKKYRNDYRFYLRHYRNSLSETVLYAI